MESVKFITLKVFGKDSESKIKLFDSDNLKQIYNTILSIYPDVRNVSIVYKGKIIQSTDDLREVENNSILFIFSNNSPFEKFAENPEFLKIRKMMDQIFMGPQNLHNPRNFHDHCFNIEDIQMLLRANGVDLDTQTIIQHLEMNNFDIHSLLNQFGIR